MGTITFDYKNEKILKPLCITFLTQPNNFSASSSIIKMAIFSTSSSALKPKMFPSRTSPRIKRLKISY